MAAAGASSVLERGHRGFSARIAVAGEERALAGAVSGVFYLIGAVTLVPVIALVGSGPTTTPRC